MILQGSNFAEQGRNEMKIFKKGQNFAIEIFQESEQMFFIQFEYEKYEIRKVAAVYYY